MPIELVQAGPFMLLQFNTTCEEALPSCGALCCRMRPQFTAPVTEEESVWMKWHYIEEAGFPRKVLDDDGNGNCIYLVDSKCSIQDKKPEACRSWHCSPGGNPGDPTVTNRDAGWGLWPARSA